MVEIDARSPLGRACVDFLQGSRQVLFALPEGEPAQLLWQGSVHFGRRCGTEVSAGQRGQWVGPERLKVIRKWLGRYQCLDPTVR